MSWLKNCKTEAIVIIDGFRIQNQGAGVPSGEDHKALAQWNEREKEETGKTVYHVLLAVVCLSAVQTDSFLSEGPHRS